MKIPTEPIGSIPRPRERIAAAIAAAGDAAMVAQLHDDTTKDDPSTTPDTGDVNIRARIRGAQPVGRVIRSE